MFKNFKRLTSLLLILILALSLTVGCNKTETSSKGNSIEQSQVEDKERIITDMSGREVKIPSKVEKVYSTSPIAQMAVYTIDSKKLTGLLFELTEMEKKYTVEGYSELPILGGWFGKDNKGNIEEILKVDPDVIIAMGDVDDASKQFADDLQKQIGKPVVIADGELEKTPESYKFLGEVLNEEKRAQELADYCEKTLKESKEIADSIKEEEKVTIYYAQGPEGLQTDPAKSTHAGVFDFVGAKNIADVESKGGYGRTEVSIEQILNWNPDKIIVCKDKNNKTGKVSSSYETITTDNKWSSLRAVKENQVYEIPDSPYNIIDRPPSVSRILGIKWLGNLLYPDKFKYDIEQETKEFYEKFYHYELKDGDIEEILQNAIAN
ncbi:ABC transporter periplasmic binding protein [Gottschalkia acidurici 9a]|uniref:ABC transporter periplasmic binding protein n=1 Tax=Gottschalkia acidurici (strain ATCC 7906 / DSM 604 / BCRC 14475 / CIP 104303 / KCTC 5404 / NCIMB 10678 / 9a) TaxID=1128398 RepID=K0AYR9_GOTA9|nr:ABC transporter substrate-binding protein [Gottschalkia acidurici]AFS78918.1 ABC transporter periplasmic binding protein [Gottschalkia acidurici 9a]